MVQGGGGQPSHGVDWLGLVGWLVSLAFEGTNLSFVSLSVSSVSSSKLEMLLVYSLMESLNHQQALDEKDQDDGCSTTGHLTWRGPTTKGLRFPKDPTFII